MNNIRIRFPALAIVAMLAALMAFAIACGDDESNTDTSTEPPAAAQPSPEPDAASDIETSIASTLVAIDSIDSAGFHDMAEDLAEAAEINPRHAGKVGNVLTVIAATAWSEDVRAELDVMTADLKALKTALDADDLEGARTHSEAVHDSQHDFSKAVYGWLDGHSGGLAAASDHVGMISVLAAQDIVDSAGFHGMAEDLAEATEINPRWAGQVGKVLTAVNVAAWPAATQADVDAVTADLTRLKAALDAEDLEGARTAAEAVHDSQHDHSKATHAWLGGQHMEHGAVASAMFSACMLKAQDLVDSAGFHGLAEDLAEATEISPRWAGTVGNVIAVVESMEWPAAVSAELETVKADLLALKTALDAEDIEGARTHSEAIHDSQHDLSKALYGWLATQAL